MEYEVIEQKNHRIACVDNDENAFFDGASAMDFLATVHDKTDCDRVALRKELLPENFFILSTGLAGEVLQKFINYRMKIAVYGDFSGYTSKPLKDFMYESNRGQDVFFCATREEAVARLAQAR